MPAGGEAVDRYVAQQEAFASDGGAKAPAWLRERRAAAIERFAALGFPTTRQEEWRFTSVAPIVESDFEPAAPPPRTRAMTISPGPEPRLVLLNGRYSRELSSLGGLPQGIRVTDLRSALAGDSASLLERHLARHVGSEGDAFAALNTAFLQDGALVHVGRGVDFDPPLEVIFITEPGAAAAVTHPRLLVVVEDGARAAVVETYLALGDGPYWTNAVTEVVVGEDAHLELVRVEQEAQAAYHVATTHATQGRDSLLRLHPLAFGAALARHDITTVLDGTGAELVLNGLYVLGGKQHADHHTVIDHAQPDCQSHEFFNGVLDGAAHGVFNGRIIVRPGAQRTDSKQTNHNLVLSEEARADSQPQLEIYADDVKCTHGATLGPLAPQEMFYLESRGLTPAEARALLTYGFGAEILGRMRHPALRERFDRAVRDRLAAVAVGSTL